LTTQEKVSKFTRVRCGRGNAPERERGDEEKIPEEMRAIF
jgi:hypothetical protein